MLRRGHHEEGFHVGRHLVVELGHLKFAFKIRYSPQAAQDDPGIQLFHIVHQQSVKLIKAHVGQMSACAGEQFQPLSDGKAPLLGRVVQHCHHHFGEDVRAALNQIQMADGHGVKAAGIYAQALFHVRFLLTYTLSR